MKTTMLTVFFTFSVILLQCVSSEQQLSFSNTFGSNMVLQREPSSANIYGFATPNDVIKVTFNGNTYTDTADSNGQWLVTLPPTPSSGPYTITATSAKSGEASISNVLFGDVYICSGQSNMKFTVKQASNATQEIKDANNYPQIRLFTVGQGNISYIPMNNLISIAQPWSVASSTSVASKSPGAYFSAVCWFYGKYLADTFPGLNIGLISSNWGGTFIQAWSSPVALAKCNITAKDTERYVEQMNKENEAPESISPSINPNQNSVLWNAMIYPFLKQSISGVLWYQAEQNSRQPDLYSCMFPAMISDWRSNFNNLFPFYFVQLAPWITTLTTLAQTRQSQLSALSLPKVGFATAMDLGDPTSPEGSIHPRDKQDVSKRLLSAALSISYDKPNPSYPPPFLSSASSSLLNGTYSYQLTFNVPETDHLVSVNNVCPKDVPTNICQNFAFLLSDGKLYPATSVTITGYNTVSVSVNNAPSGLTVSGLQYCFSAWPVATLYNSEGQPVIPFFYQ